MGVWDTPMYEIDDQAVDRAGERGARFAGQIRDRRAYRRAGQNFNLDSASDVLAGGQGQAPVDESARIRAVASDRASRGDFEGRADLVNQLNVETNQGLNQARARTQNVTDIGPFAVNIIRGTSGMEPERRRRVLEANRQRFIDAGFTPEQVEAGFAGLTGPEAAQWEQEIIRGFTQAPEAQVSEQTGDIFTIDPVTQAPQVTGQVPGADLIRREATAGVENAEAGVAVTQRAARAPYPAGRGGDGDGDLSNTDIRTEMSFGDRWRGVYNNFAEIRNSYERIRSMSGQRNAAGDLALVVSFTKMLDPGSVAREGEVALTQSAASALAQAQNFVPRLQQGNTLLPASVRNQLVAAAQEMYANYEATYNRLGEQYYQTALSYGFDPNRALMGYQPGGDENGAADPLGIRGQR